MTIFKRFIAMLFALLLVAPAFAQAPQAPRAYSQAELDRMLAPVALYPDPLLSQILMAATYPAEVMEAAQWSRAHPNLQGDDAVRAAADQDWDPSVKSLLAFPELLARMDENVEWTQSLGDAFLGQESLVMDTVQQLRRRAYAQGNLRSDERIHVQPQGETIIIAPAVAEVIYVPYYDPLVVYGDWWWPDYRPIYWAPWRGYARHHHFWWGAPIRISVGFFFGGFDWRHRHVRVGHVHRHYNWSRRDFVAGRWQHDGARRVEARQRIEQRADRRELRERLERAEQRSERRQEARQEQRREDRRDERRAERRDERRDNVQERREQLREQLRQRTQETRPEQRENRQDWREQRREQLREQIRERTQLPRPEQREQRQEWREQRREQLREQVRDHARERAPEQRQETRQERREERRDDGRDQRREQMREQFQQRQQQRAQEMPRAQGFQPQPRQEAPRVVQPQHRQEAPRVHAPAPRQEVRQERREARQETRQEARQERREERRERGRGS